MRVICAMSGGVDSSVAAALMVDAGHDVVGMTMRLYDAPKDGKPSRAGTCCSPAEIDLARRACAALGIAHYVVDERVRFERDVIDPFARDYAAGRTPNPCTRCNQSVKFGPLLHRAAALGAERLVTGHYARLEAGVLRRGVDPRKDQSYFLFAMGRKARNQTLFPLGSWTKDDVRERAHSQGLPAAAAPDSQELCFVPDGDHGRVVEQRLRALGLPTDTLQPGDVVDLQGEIVGKHEGVHRVTVGQRKGLQIPGGRRRYVLRVLPEQRAVVVGDAIEARVTALDVGEVQLSGSRPVGDSFRAHVQVRHRATAMMASVTMVTDDRARVDFDASVPAVSAGQAAVFYVDDVVVGGGWIDAVSRQID